MTLTLQEAGDGKRIVGGVEYARALFQEGDDCEVCGIFPDPLLEGMVANENETIDGLRDILPEEEEREQLLYGVEPRRRGSIRSKTVCA